jgi:hypothetical protein
MPICYNQSSNGKIEFALYAHDTHWYLGYSAATYSGIHQPDSEMVQWDNRETDSCIDKVVSRSSDYLSKNDNIIKGITQEIKLILKDDLIYTAYKFMYANTMNNKLTEKITRTEWPLLSFALLNQSGGNNKVRVQLVDVIRTFVRNNQRTKLVSMVLCKLKGSREIRITCILVSILSTIHCDVEGWNDILRDITTENFIDILKQDHEYLRQGEKFVKDYKKQMYRCMLLYKHVLNGRVDEKLDWDAELAKRVNGELCNEKKSINFSGTAISEESYANDLNIELDSMFQHIQVNRVMSLDDFFNNYYLLIVGGSYFDEDTEHDTQRYTEELNEKFKGLKLNKRTVGLTSGYEKYKLKMLNIQKEKIRLKTKAHQKMQEQTKARSIYQTTFLHYLVCAYLLLPIEQNLTSLNIFMNVDAFSTIGRYAMRIQKFKKGVVNSFDFEDFNAQHTFKDMQCVLRHTFSKVSSCITDTNVKELYDDLSDWVIASVSNTYTYRNGVKYQWKAGLPSGVRYTSYMNNILNYCYTKIMYNGLSRIYPELNFDYKSMEVCGDDSYHVFNTEYESNLFNVWMQKCGYSIQLSKQMTSEDTFEFLRLQYYPSGLVGGCINRAISNFVCGNWEGDGSTTIEQVLNELYPNMVTMMKRGMSVSMGIKVFEIALRNSLLIKSYENGNFEDFMLYMSKSSSVTKFVMCARQYTVDDGGYDMTFYYEKYKLSNPVKFDMIEIKKSFMEVQENDGDSTSAKPQSIKDLSNMLQRWIVSKDSSIGAKSVKMQRIVSNCYKLATAGAQIDGTGMNQIRKQIASVNESRILHVHNATKQVNYSPARFINDPNLSVLLVQDIKLYQYYDNFKQRIPKLQSIESVNMDIIKYWLIESALNSSDKNRLYKIIFGKKITILEREYIDNIWIDKKGKVKSRLAVKPSNVLRVLADSQDIMNVCIAVDRSSRMYKCVLVKEMARRALKITIRN